jgi:hypothetical protein
MEWVRLAGVHHRDGGSGAAVAARVSGGREPHLEGPDQGPTPVVGTGEGHAGGHRARMAPQVGLESTVKRSFSEMQVSG